MKKHYEEIVTAKYLGHRNYDVTVSEIEVTKNGKGEEIRETVRSAKELFTEPTLLSAFFAGETLEELYGRRMVEIDEKFKLNDFDKCSILDIAEALHQAAEKAYRVLSVPYIY